MSKRKLTGSLSIFIGLGLPGMYKGPIVKLSYQFLTGSPFP